MAAAPWPAGTPPSILYADHGYVLARRGEALMGSTMEHAGFDGRVTDAGIDQVVAAAIHLLPALENARPTRTWAGLRPLTPDGRPIVGADPETEGLWFATGHGRNGILLAALTGDIVADLLAKGATDIEIAPFTIARFQPSAISDQQSADG
jgi:glycine oxidase